MDILLKNPVQILFGDVIVTLPHPADFALHKLLISGRRKNKDKAEKDRTQAISLLNALNTVGDIEAVHSEYSAMPKSWKKTIIKELSVLKENKLVSLLENK